MKTKNTATHIIHIIAGIGSIICLIAFIYNIYTCLIYDFLFTKEF